MLYKFYRRFGLYQDFSVSDLQLVLLLSCQGNFVRVSGTSIQHRWNCEVTCRHTLTLMPLQPSLRHCKNKYKASYLCSFSALVFRSISQSHPTSLLLLGVISRVLALDKLFFWNTDKKNNVYDYVFVKDFLYMRRF